MREIFYGIFICLISVYSFAQKPQIDSSVFGKWTEINNAQITPNGRYTVYTVLDKIENRVVLHIVSNDDSFRIQIVDASSPHFTGDSRLVLFLKGKDSLGMFGLNNRTMAFIPHVSSFRCQEDDDKGWFAYLSS